MSKDGEWGKLKTLVILTMGLVGGCSLLMENMENSQPTNQSPAAVISQQTAEGKQRIIDEFGFTIASGQGLVNGLYDEAVSRGYTYPRIIDYIRQELFSMGYRPKDQDYIKTP